MNKIILILMTLLCVSPLMAQIALNNKADNIVGTYSGKQGDDNFKAKIVKLSNGTYRGQVIWLEHDRDTQGRKILDTKNPDKSLRSKPADQIILFSGLKYDAKKHRWDNTKIYDPQRGLKANMTAEFTADGNLRIKGSLMGISESVYWSKIE
ncbi:MAG: DUF2147 domain-containing protein [Bacteroidales bacterium]|nr:DUF2147 domain-containing protein [Bacteroidales bacterium]